MEKQVLNCRETAHMLRVSPQTFSKERKKGGKFENLKPVSYSDTLFPVSRVMAFIDPDKETEKDIWEKRLLGRIGGGQDANTLSH